MKRISTLAGFLLLSLMGTKEIMADSEIVRRSILTVSDAVMGTVALNYRKDYHASYQHITDASSDTKNLALYDNLRAKTRYYNASALFGSVAFWNILDIIASANIAKYPNSLSPDHVPNPKKAMALSAIPFSGAGQFYNAEWFKAGLVIATQSTFVFGGVQYQYLMLRSKELADDSNKQSMHRRYQEASRRRTMYYWYAIIFYIYGITDAYVDAHLSDSSKKLEILPDISIDNRNIGFTLSWKF